MRALLLIGTLGVMDLGTATAIAGIVGALAAVVAIIPLVVRAVRVSTRSRAYDRPSNPIDDWVSRERDAPEFDRGRIRAIGQIVEFRRMTERMIGTIIALGHSDIGMTERGRLDFAAHRVLELSDYEPLRQAYQSLSGAFGWSPKDDPLPDERSVKTSMFLARKMTSARRAAVVEAATNLERITRVMAMDYGHELDKPALPWGSRS